MHLPTGRAFVVLMPCALISVTVTVAQVKTDAPPAVVGAKPVTVERIKIHGASLEGNLEGNTADRDTFVFLPPTYSTDKRRRYPVVYALHGYSIGESSTRHRQAAPPP